MNNRYVLIFHGDGKRAELCDGWDELEARVRAGLWDGEPEQPEWGETLSALLDPDNWEHDDQGPWRYSESYEDGSMAIYRVGDEAKGGADGE